MEVLHNGHYVIYSLQSAYINFYCILKVYYIAGMISLDVLKKLLKKLSANNEFTLINADLRIKLSVRFISNLVP